jgi:predicted peptidase
MPPKTPPRPTPITADQLVDRVFTTEAGTARKLPGDSNVPAGGAPFSLPYRLYVPRDYQQSRRYALLVVLHGAGERGTDNVKHLGNGVLAFCDDGLQKKLPTFVVYPQCPEGAQWVDAPWSAGQYDQAKVPLSRPLAAVTELMTALASEFTIDPNGGLVAGLSMGGYGAWDLITRFPQRFAGAVTICGGGDPNHAAEAKPVPVWAFHGSKDEVVPVAGSRLMVAALKKAGGKVKYHEFAGADHHVWQRVFDDRAVLTWLLSQYRPKRG